MPNKTTAIFAGLVAAVLALAAAWYFWPSDSAPNRKGGEAQGVIIASANIAPFADVVEAIGTLRANETVILTSNVADTVSRVNFSDGQRVSTGDVLVEMTSAEESAQLAEAQAALDEAERQLERLRPLVADGAASKSLLDQRQRELDVARAKLAAVQSRLSDLIIVAPFDGVLGLRNISIGSFVQAGETITTLDDDSVMKLDFSVPSLFLDSLRPGLRIKAYADGDPNRPYEGTIEAIDSQIDPVTRSVVVRALLPNPDRQLRPGLLMSVRLYKNERQSILIPEEALLQRNDKSFVYVIVQENGIPVAREQVVSLGTRDTGRVEITEGLQPGTAVIVDGIMRIHNGMPVRVVGALDADKQRKDLISGAPTTQDNN